MLRLQNTILLLHILSFTLYLSSIFIENNIFKYCSLDAHYHGEYKDYANLLEISEKDAKKEIEEDFNESIQQQFDDSDNITDKGIADYAEKLAEVKKAWHGGNSVYRL